MCEPAVRRLETDFTDHGMTIPDSLALSFCAKSQGVFIEPFFMIAAITAGIVGCAIVLGRKEDRDAALAQPG